MKKMNILIPMAGLGKRFSKCGFKNCKPLIPLNGKTFIEWSIDSVNFKNINTQFIFIILEENCNELTKHLKKNIPDCIIYIIPKLTRGATETCLAAIDSIDNDVPLIITNSDQIFEWDKEKYINYLVDNKIEANVVTVKANTDKFSYIKLNEEGYGIKLAEKEIISEYALAGIHYWNKGRLFIESAKELIKRDIRSKNEYYI